MLSDAYKLNIKNAKEENSMRGTSCFPCSCYKGELHQFFTEYLPVHWHKEFEMFRLDCGKVKIVTEDCVFELLEGEGYFANSGALHGIYPLVDTECAFHSMVFDTSVIGGAPGSAFDLLYVKPFVENGLQVFPICKEKAEDDMWAAFERAYMSCVQEPENYEFTVRKELSDIFLILKREQKQYLVSFTSCQVARIKQMVKYMEENYDKDVTIEMIAKSVNVCPRECQRSFKEIMHVTPFQYLTNIRITMAIKMLLNGRYSISEIASACGFESCSYFSKQFKSAVGKTPRQYREENMT